MGFFFVVFSWFLGVYVRLLMRFRRLFRGVLGSESGCLGFWVFGVYLEIVLILLIFVIYVVFRLFIVFVFWKGGGGSS